MSSDDKAPTLLAEIRLGSQTTAEPELALWTDGVQRWVWESRFGEMLIEVKDGAVFVNGSRVTPAAEIVARANAGRT